ncbi:hypothetical protein MYIN104542_30395 [Mycobacterium intermedium]
MFPLPRLNCPKSAKPRLKVDPDTPLRNKPARSVPTLYMPDMLAGVVSGLTAEPMLKKPDRVWPKLEKPDASVPTLLRPELSTASQLNKPEALAPTFQKPDTPPAPLLKKPDDGLVV